MSPSGTVEPGHACDRKAAPTASCWWVGDRRVCGRFRSWKRTMEDNPAANHTVGTRAPVEGIEGPSADSFVASACSHGLQGRAPPLTLHARRVGGCVCGSVDAPSVVGRTGGCSAMSLRRLQYHCRGCMAARVAVVDARNPAVCPNVEIPSHNPTLAEHPPPPKRAPHRRVHRGSANNVATGWPNPLALNASAHPGATLSCATVSSQVRHPLRCDATTPKDPPIAVCTALVQKTRHSRFVEVG